MNIASLRHLLTDRPSSPTAARGGPDGAEDGAPNGASHGAERGTPPGRFAPLHGGSHGSYGVGNGARHGVGNGAGKSAPRAAPRGPEVDAEMVLYRMEEAGRTLLALPQSGYTTRLRTSSINLLRSALEAESAAEPNQTRLRPPVPSPARISRMDEAFGWVTLIPRERYVIRRIVGCRALVSPVTERHLFSWRRIGVLLGADHKAIQRWHAQGIDMIVAAVNARR